MSAIINFAASLQGLGCLDHLLCVIAEVNLSSFNAQKTSEECAIRCSSSYERNRLYIVHCGKFLSVYCLLFLSKNSLRPILLQSLGPPSGCHYAEEVKR